MTVLGLSSVALEVADVEAGIDFYERAGLRAERTDQGAALRCPDQDQPAIILVAGAARKRLHHVRLRADLSGVGVLADKVAAGGGVVIEPPVGCEPTGLWVRDPHGVTIHLAPDPEPASLRTAPDFAINAPGRLVRTDRSAMLPRAHTPPVAPLRLGHVLLFTPDVPASIAFFTEALGMGLADKSADVIAFLCSRHGSDHHVVAFAKSPGVGFHHASFQVEGPDEVGRAGAALAAASERGDWGFGRHTIGSNFFHYIQDPWGSWFEYYSDIDYIGDYPRWRPTDYALEDSLANWGPALPHDFVTNYEVEVSEPGGSNG